MSPTQVVVLFLVLLAVAAAAAVGWAFIRRRALRSRFGPEYERLLAEEDNRTAVERELRERERRHAELTLTPLRPESRARYQAAWEELQVRFVDEPAEVVSSADELVTRIVSERGYPAGDFDNRLADLSVEHARTLHHYRDGHEILLRGAHGEAGTEELRQALVHYRALFADLLGTDQDSGRPSGSDGRPDPDNRPISRSEPVDTPADPAEPAAATTEPRDDQRRPPAPRRPETPHDVTSR